MVHAVGPTLRSRGTAEPAWQGSSIPFAPQSLTFNVRPMQVAADEVAQHLGSIPQEVRDAWLNERIDTAGWPPTGARWNALLAGYAPDQWVKFTWHKEELDLSTLSFSTEAIRIISGLSEARFGNVRNAYYDIDGSAERMRCIYAHMKETRRLPGSPVLVKSEAWDIVDGCHRITMYSAWLRNSELAPLMERNQSVWVATA